MPVKQPDTASVPRFSGFAGVRVGCLPAPPWMVSSRSRSISCVMVKSVMGTSFRTPRGAARVPAAAPWKSARSRGVRWLLRRPGWLGGSPIASTASDVASFPGELLGRPLRRRAAVRRNEARGPAHDGQRSSVSRARRGRRRRSALRPPSRARARSRSRRRLRVASRHGCEDTATTYSELVATFGAPIADGVRALSKLDDSIPKAERMADSLRRIRLQPREVWVVKLANRITNLAPPPAGWSSDKRRAYRDEAIEIADALGRREPGAGGPNSRANRRLFGLFLSLAPLRRSRTIRDATSVRRAAASLAVRPPRHGRHRAVVRAALGRRRGCSSGRPRRDPRQVEVRRHVPSDQRHPDRGPRGVQAPHPRSDDRSGYRARDGGRSMSPRRARTTSSPSSSQSRTSRRRTSSRSTRCRRCRSPRPPIRARSRRRPTITIRTISARHPAASMRRAHGDRRAAARASSSPTSRAAGTPRTKTSPAIASRTSPASRSSIASWRAHGTAVLGEVVGRDNGEGVDRHRARRRPRLHVVDRRRVRRRRDRRCRREALRPATCS